MPRASAVKQTGATKLARPRGRPRSAAARHAILNAARHLLEEGGVGAVTIEGIAARAGVGKPTIYREWPNAHAVMMAALIDTVPSSAPVRRGRSALRALRQQLRQIAEVFATRTGRSVAHILAASESETELSKAFRHHFILARRQEGRSLLLAAIEEGMLRQDLEIDVALDLIYAPIFYRLLVGHAPVDARFTDAVLRHVVQGLA
ncbi:MAG: TetR/AcrR family transcriptional regulator [Gemmatimonadaceae bacterium]